MRCIVDPNGQIIFRQAKSVPIQFFRDGLPAEKQSLWESPWGKIGICICYGMSFSRVTDALVDQGAELLVVPTMDATSWGAHQHRLHSMVAPSRAAEYGVPIVRVCSSGISQIVDGQGRVTATLPFPGQGEMFAQRVPLGATGSVPPDRPLAWCGVAASGLLIVYIIVRWLVDCLAVFVRPKVSKLRVS